MDHAAWPKLALVPLATGLLWLLGPANQGWIAFALSVAPGALLVAGGVAAFLLPGDLRTHQVTALGGALGVLLALPAFFTVGFGGGLVLGLLSAASFAAAGWLAQSPSPSYEHVPEPPLDLRLAAKVALDEAVLGAAALRLRPPGRLQRHASVEEVRTALALFAERGWLEKPATYHAAPPPLASPELLPERTRGVDFEHLRFASEYEPPPAVPGRERWLEYYPNRTAHAWLLRHTGAPRPWLVCVHGYGMGVPWVDLGAFEPAFLHGQLGLNLLLPVLPLHGPRKIARSSGSGFIGGFELDTVHAEAQAMWDLRRMLSWVRAQDAPAVGVFGLSLGGYTTALLAALDGELACAIAGIPATNFAHLARRLASPLLLREAEAIGLSLEDLEAVFRVVSPLVLEPRVPHERRYIFGATADRLVPPDQVRDLWLHWDRPRVLWTHSSHLAALRERNVRAFLREALDESLLQA